MLMYNLIHLIVSIILKNYFSKIEIIKDPSRKTGVILPSVPMETKLLVLSVWLSMAAADTMCWVSLVSKHMIAIYVDSWSFRNGLFFWLGSVWFSRRAHCHCQVSSFFSWVMQSDGTSVSVCICGKVKHWTRSLQCNLWDYNTPQKARNTVT
jgi:hypothetical protein